MLWSLRNKLVLTYLLIGLAPVVLFVTLVLISAYIAAGQFAIHLVDSRLQAELGQMSGSERASRGPDCPGAWREAVGGGDWRSGAERRTGWMRQGCGLHPATKAFVNGAPMALDPIDGKTPLGLPPWAAELKGGEFQDLVLDGGDLYLVVVHQRRLADGRMFSLVSSMPVDGGLMDLIADGLGRAVLFPERLGSLARSGRKPAAQKSEACAPACQNRRRSQAAIAGGSEPEAMNLADVRVRFLSTMAMTDWGSGEQRQHSDRGGFAANAAVPAALWRVAGRSGDERDSRWV